ncbi:MAG: protein kinase [Polyangiaceae bacterium]|nr:protein kinase [Polyangiaceae bacterium]
MSHCLDDNSALELLDGRLTSTALARVERHLESCDACRELVAELAKAGPSGYPGTERAPIAEGSSELTRAGPYRIEREIGRGSAGTVYRAIDGRTGEAVALKYVTNPSWRARFWREIETLAQLAHPGIVRYVGHGETPHGMYLAMELLEGEDLQQRLRRGPLPWQVVRLLGIRLSAALAHAHARGAVHRDLGPRNVFLPGGRVEDAKLLDFGLVHVNDSLEHTASRAVLGTAFYMAPEQIKDPGSVDARADLFSLGVILFESISGARPFQGADLFTVWAQIVNHPPPNLRALTRGIPEAFIVLIEALLAKDPNARPASAGAVHHALLEERLISQASSSRRGSRIFIAIGAGAVAIIAASTIAVVAHQRSGDSSSAPDESSATSSDGPPSATESSDPIEATKVESESPPARLPHETPATAPSNRSPPVPTSATAPSNRSPPVPSKGAVESLFCGGDNVEHRSGGHYRADPERPTQKAVLIGGGCKATLEDCVIDGPHSVSVMGTGELTLRRCQVLGDVSLFGPAPMLTLEGTELPKAPQIAGEGRVIRR